MKFGKAEEFSTAVDKAKILSDSVFSRVHMPVIFGKIKAKSAILLPFGFIVALAAGILLGASSEGLSSGVNSSAEAFIDGYS